MLRTARWRDIPRNGGLPLTASEDLRTADNHNSVEAPHDSPDCNHMTQDHSGSSQIPDPQEPGDNIFVVVVSGVGSMCYVATENEDTRLASIRGQVAECR